MRDKGRIRVIKKGTEVPAPTVEKPEKNESKKISREMVETVTDWVKEMQNRKRQEAELSVHKLFGGVTQANGA